MSLAAEILGKAKRYGERLSGCCIVYRMALLIALILQRNYINVNFVTRSILEEWEYSAEILIAHFRCIMRGQIPFSNDSNVDESCDRAELDEQSMAYVRRIIELVKSRGM